jgi:hypothetical protein
LREVIENETPKVESINILDDIGMTPFLAYIEKFCSSFEEIRSMKPLVVARDPKS